MLGALTSRTRATTDALLREARFDAATVHERHSAGEPSPSWSNGSCDITVLLFTTKIKQCVRFSPPHNCSFKLEIAFCVRGVLSPVVSNIVLNELDQELERRGHRFTRYADDCNIYVRSRRASERVIRSVTRLLTTKLKLRVNSEKSAVARPWERKFLGFSFTNHKPPKRRLAPKAMARFKERVRELTSRTRGISLARKVQDLAEHLRGWIGYFGRCETPEVLAKLEKWLRRRLRSMVWKQWKRGTTRYRELRKRGIAAQDAAKTAGSSDGPWHLANTPALKIALSNAYFASFGLPELTAHG